MPPIPERERLGTSNEGRSSISVSKGPLTTTVVVTERSTVGVSCVGRYGCMRGIRVLILRRS